MNSENDGDAEYVDQGVDEWEQGNSGPESTERDESE